MRIFEGTTVEENLEIAQGNLAELTNELLWLLNHQIDDPPTQLDCFPLDDCRKLLRLILEDLPPVILTLNGNRPEATRRCEQILTVCDELRKRHPSDDPWVWSSTFSSIVTLGTYISDVAQSTARQPDLVDHEILDPSIKVTPVDEADPAIRDTPFLFRLEGDFYRIRFEGQEASLQRSKGLSYIQVLIGRPHQPVFCIDLESEVAGKPVERSELLESVVDDKAIREYRETLAATTAELAQMSPTGSPAARAELEQTIDWLTREISRSTDSNGHQRKSNRLSERSRKRVRNAISRALRKVETQLRPIGGHLRQCLSAGFLLVYRPNQPFPWNF